jgi:iron complex outermembrane receptor protein
MQRLWDSFFAASLGLIFTLVLTPAYAQPDDDELGNPRVMPDSPKPPNMEELLVTGSYIKGLTQDNLASPMESISRSDMLDIGAFRLEDIVNNLTINSGSENNSDSFTQNFTTGTSNLNLRGLGVASTLVLLNGRRQTYSAFTTDKGENFVDLSSLVPLIAVERLEVLKDGAASLYGSDAVAGVANFITRNDFEGVEVEVESLSGDNQGDLKFGAIFGTGNDSTHFMAAVSYLDREGLSADEKRLSNPPSEDSLGDDISAAGNPGTFLIPVNPANALSPTWSFLFDTPTGSVPNLANFFEPLLGAPAVAGALQPAFADPNCETIAEDDDTTVPPGTFPIGACQFDFGKFFTLVPDEERIQFYTTVSHKFSESLEWFAEVAYADISAERRNSPSFPITTTPVVCGNGSLGAFMAPPFNIDGTEFTCGDFAPHPDNVLGAGGFGADLLFIGRIAGSGGSPLISYHDSETRRLATGLSGDIDENWNWDVDISDSSNQFELRAADTLAREFQLALFGLGGEDCSGNPADAGDAGEGCSYFNPFGSALTGDGTENTAEIFDYITAPVTIDAEAELQTITAVTSRNVFPMTGGDAALAVGLQSREESLDYDYDQNSNEENFIFFTGNPDFEGDRTIRAIFSELAMPVTQDIDVQLSVRSEDYDDAGKSTDPKISALWRATENAALRGSIGTSFRAPSLFQQSGIQTTLVGINIPGLGSQFIPVRALPNPDDPLEPEEADVFNIGASWAEEEGFNISLDYWSYDYSNVIIQQNAQAVLNAALEPGESPEDEQVQSTSAGVGRITVYYDNASKLETDGVDLATGYNWATGESFYQVDLNLTKVMSYDLEDPQAGSIDGMGQRNYTNFASSMPELRSNLHFLWNMDRHAVNLFARHIDSYENDQVVGGEAIDAQTTFDAQYSYRFAGWTDDDLLLTVGGINITDEDPPHVATFGGYDSKVHDPRGALYYVKLSVPIF